MKTAARNPRTWSHNLLASGLITFALFRFGSDPTVATMGFGTLWSVMLGVFVLDDMLRGAAVPLVQRGVLVFLTSLPITMAALLLKALLQL